MLGFKDQIKNLSNHYDALFASGVICILFILLFPIPSSLIDFLLSISVTFSILILITVLFLSKPLDLSSFPSILLLSTMLRLALNIASTRLILLQGHIGTSAAGHVIESFGKFVMHGSVVIGLIVFMILTIINFVVITKGSGRIAEVSARFSLDAMPGKQMSIDADLNSGIINDEMAKLRRKELEEESTFFGAMDGASKFVRGDAIAGILITFINFIGGMIIGILERGMTFPSAIHTYTILTIGDGLVSQIPALIISVSAGLLVTKSGVTGSTDQAIFTQIGKYPRAIGLTSFFLLAIGIIPGMPFIPFFITSALTASISFLVIKKQKLEESVKSQNIKKETTEKDYEKILHLDSISIELGSNLLSLASENNKNNITTSVKSLRKQIMSELGFVIPSVRVQDNLSLNSDEYIIKIKNIECGHGSIKIHKLLILSSSSQKFDIIGEPTTEPAFGLPAMWIEQTLRDEAILKNYTIVEPNMVIMTHLTEIVKDNISDLVSYSSIQNLLDGVDQENKKLIYDVIPTQVTIPLIQKIAQNLLVEKISIRDLPTIIEAILEGQKVNQNPVFITEFVRSKLSRQISNMYTTKKGYIPTIVISQKWEQIFAESIHNESLAMAPSKLQEFVNELKSIIKKNENEEDIVLVSSSIIRHYIFSIVQRLDMKIPVISQNEIHPKYNTKTMGSI